MNNNQKVNLSHWDIAVDFTGSQAAALSLGFDPAEASSKLEKSLPLYQRMERCYNSKKVWLWGDMGPMEDGLIEKSDMLESLELRWWALEREPGTWGDYCDWVKADNESRFEQQRFKRQELVRWFAAVEFHSIYQFDSALADTQVAPSPGTRPSTNGEWTPTRREELRAYKEKHGSKPTAAHYGISESRIRQVLAKDKFRPKASRSFPWPEQ